MRQRKVEVGKAAYIGDVAVAVVDIRWRWVGWLPRRVAVVSRLVGGGSSLYEWVPLAWVHR